jgi:hypothetical protein
LQSVAEIATLVDPGLKADFPDSMMKRSLFSPVVAISHLREMMEASHLASKREKSRDGVSFELAFPI